ncbi:hypothetical protein NAEGRDRAFT_79393 [Naegleria gruberi]|uniref:Uncharacterized protein n=1 Tax=Naegleria gruberi TaxID=5762 RepID=D2VC55_NAEGR|nr:uncharacterized protein NAEGRDRAFT_79393 [Naegleria gruberi]EFC45598.1 hypothetical protein NAEGRDRAFT_79393 [Naegleria gruberi]|eukprot:XP_002678342.1 hypothetical protein NAEGRDRAFT_79393 [Naegleria gruberi strain NEG-M]
MGKHNKKKNNQAKQQHQQQEPPNKKNKTEPSSQPIYDLSSSASDANSSDTTVVSPVSINSPSIGPLNVVSNDQQKNFYEDMAKTASSLEKMMTLFGSYNQKLEQSSKIVNASSINLEKSAKELEKLCQIKAENEKLKKEAATHMKEIQDNETKLKRLNQAEQKNVALEKENSTLKEQAKSVMEKVNQIQTENEKLTQENKRILENEIQCLESIRSKDMEILSLKNRKDFQVSDSKTEELVSEMSRLTDNANNLVFDLIVNLNEDDETSKWVEMVLSTVINKSSQLSEEELSEAILAKSYTKAWQEFASALNNNPHLQAKMKNDAPFQSIFQQLVKSSCRIVDICEKSTVPKFKRDWSSSSDKVCIVPAVVIDTDNKRVVVVDGRHVEKSSK